MAVRWYDPTEPTLQQQATTLGRFETYRMGVTPEYAGRVQAMFATNPNLRPGTGLALARANVDPTGPIAQAAVQAEAKQAHRGLLGSIAHGIGDAVAKTVSGASGVVGDVLGAQYAVAKGVSRGADIGLTSIGQTVQGTWRASRGDGQFGTRLSDVKQGFEQSDLAVGMDEVRDKGGYLGLLTGKTDVDYGSGFFAGGDVKAEGVRRRRAAGPLIDNHAATLGRSFAHVFLEPGSVPYSLLSGVIDGGVALGSDPTNWLGGEGTAVRFGGRGVREGIERGRTFADSARDVVHESRVVVPDSPAKAAARAFGDQKMSAAEFLSRAQQHGSDNPAVASVVKSLDDGLLTKGEATQRLEGLRDRIKVEAGVVEGIRKTVLPDVARDWLTVNRRGRQFVAWAQNSTSVAEMRRATEGKIPTETLVKLAEAKTEDDVIHVVGPLLGTTIRDRPVIRGNVAQVKVRRAKASSRWLNLMPHDVVDLEDLDDLVTQVDRLGAVAKMPLADRDHFVNRAAATAGGNRNDRLQVLFDMTKHLQDQVLHDREMEQKARGLTGRVNPHITRAATRMWKDVLDDHGRLRTYAIDELGNPMRVPGAPVVKVGDETIAQPSPHLLSEHIGQYAPLPDARELRRATSKTFDTLAKIPGANRSADALIAVGDLANMLFKQGALLRLAYPLRVVGEEQARMAASGMHSAYVHPLSYISMAMGRKLTRGATGDPFEAAAEHAAALSVGSAGWFGEAGKVRVPGKMPVGREAPNFARFLADNLSEYHSDDLMRRVANGSLLDGDVTPNPQPGLDGIKDWFWAGDGAKQRELLATGADSAGAPKSRADIFATKFDPNDPLGSSDGYVDSLVERLKVATNNDPRLLEAVATGQINGQPLMLEIAPKRFAPNRKAVTELQKIVDEGAGPAYVKGDILLSGMESGSKFGKLGEHYDAATERIFHALMSAPTNKLSRSPTFRQLYWKRQAELVRFMAPEAQQQALRVAREEGLPKDVLRKLEQGAATRSGELTIAEADQLGKAYGLDGTRKLLYDLHNRNNFWDAARMVFPFGQAWQEVAQTWGGLIKTNPLVLRRGQQLVNGLRSTNVDGQDQGLFYTNEHGEEVFAFPFSGWVQGKALGLPTEAAPRLTASVQGLNMFSSSAIPGLGPVVTVPLAKVLPQRPEYEDIHKLLFPFGEKEYEGGLLGGFAGSLAPGWAQKLKTGLAGNPDNDRIFANHVAYVSRTLLSTGKYDTSTAEGQQKLQDDALAGAKRLYLWRAVTQVWAPSAPSQEFVTLDKDGQGVLQARMMEEYQKLQTEDYKTAMQRFVEMFGVDAVLNTVNRTSGGASPTVENNRWMQRNPDVVRTYRDTYGYFLPREGDYSYEMYRAQLETGERKEITPDEAVGIANQRLGTMVYNQYKAKLGLADGQAPSKAQRAWLQQVREKIEVQFPGYNPTPANMRERKLLITKLEQAAGDDTLGGTDAGQGLRLYLNYRAQAQQAAQAQGLSSFTNAKSAAPLRAWLRDVADRIAEQHPDFGEMFDRTFDQEMVSDT